VKVNIFDKNCVWFRLNLRFKNCVWFWLSRRFRIPAWNSITTILVWDWLQSYLQLILSKRIMFFICQSQYFWEKLRQISTQPEIQKLRLNATQPEIQNSSLIFNHNYFGLRLTIVKHLAPISHLMSTVAEIVFGLGYSPYSWYPGTCIALYLRSLRFIISHPSNPGYILVITSFGYLFTLYILFL